jgi:hypothetical protein
VGRIVAAHTTTRIREGGLMNSPASTRSLFRADATFEALLGALLAAGALGDVITNADIPVGRAVIVAAGASFLLASASQFVYFINAPRRVLLELAIGNCAMAAAGLVWIAIDRGFSAAGAALLCGAVAWKLAIGLLQTRSLMPRALREH